MNKITKLPKQWIEENEFFKYYYFIKNNEIYFHRYDKELNEFISKNERSNWSIKNYLYNINNPNDHFWYKNIRPIIIKALDEEEFSKMIKNL